VTGERHYVDRDENRDRDRNRDRGDRKKESHKEPSEKSTAEEEWARRAAEV
jgi:hypothetical protein